MYAAPLVSVNRNRSLTVRILRRPGDQAHVNRARPSSMAYSRGVGGDAGAAEVLLQGENSAKNQRGTGSGRGKASKASSPVGRIPPALPPSKAESTWMGESVTLGGRIRPPPSLWQPSRRRTAMVTDADRATGPSRKK